MMKPRRQHGSTLFVTMAAIAILAFLAAHVCRVVTSRYRQVFQADAWHHALGGAEAGADIAMGALNSGDWTGWVGPDINGVVSYDMPALTTGGEGGTSVTATVQVDSPPSFTNSSGRFYRIRSTGRATMPGGGYVGFDKYDNTLRRLSLVRDRNTGAQVTGGPNVSRTVEVVARPSPLFARAVTLSGWINASFAGSAVDSYDSGDPAKSTAGLYDPAKLQARGGISSNDSTGSDFGAMPVRGDVSYAGPVIPNMQGVTGTITNPSTERILAVAKPVWTTVTANVGSVNASMTWTAGPPGSPTRYKATDLAFMPSDVLTLAPPLPGQPGEIEVWISGDIVLAGSGQILVPPGVRATFWFEGNIQCAGSIVDNQNGLASAATFHGISPSDGSSKSIKMGGGAATTAALDAPACDVNIFGGGSFYGAFIAKSVLFNASAVDIHYDEALGRLGGGPYYSAASFAEDVR